MTAYCCIGQARSVPVSRNSPGTPPALGETGGSCWNPSVSLQQVSTPHVENPWQGLHGCLLGRSLGMPRVDRGKQGAKMPSCQLEEGESLLHESIQGP